MNVTTNQVDQLYVVSAETAAGVAPAATGDLQVLKSSSEGLGKGDTHYFKYMGAAGLERTDLLKEGQITEVKITDASAQAIPLHRVVVELKPEVLSAGKPIMGEDYELKIAISQFQDLAEDSIYYKYGFVHTNVVSTPDVDTFWREMAKSLAKNFSREITKFFKFYITDGNLEDEILLSGEPKTSNVASGAATGIIIEEQAQIGHLALMPTTGVDFKVTTDTIVVDGDEIKWGDVKDATVYDFIKNGYAIADMEYFYQGERGDQYRMFAAPQDRIEVERLVDKTKEYDVIDIHYYFVDSLGGAQKSEKDLTIVVEHDGAVVTGGSLNTGNDAANLVKNIKTALKVATIKAVDGDGKEYIF